MRILFYLVMIAIITGCTFKKPSNYAECILEDMPGTSNESVRYSIHRQCSSKFPNLYDEIKQGEGLGFNSSFKNRDECVIAKNKNTVNQNATININLACSCLYEKPSYDGEICNGNPFATKLKPFYEKLDGEK
jgi:hypothetical protein